MPIRRVSTTATTYADFRYSDEIQHTFDTQNEGKKRALLGKWINRALDAALITEEEDRQRIRENILDKTDYKYSRTYSNAVYEANQIAVHGQKLLRECGGDKDKMRAIMAVMPRSANNGGFQPLPDHYCLESACRGISANRAEDVHYDAVHTHVRSDSIREEASRLQRAENELRDLINEDGPRPGSLVLGKIHQSHMALIAERLDQYQQTGDLKWLEETAKRWTSYEPYASSSKDNGTAFRYMQALLHERMKPLAERNEYAQGLPDIKPGETPAKPTEKQLDTLIAKYTKEALAASATYVSEREADKVTAERTLKMQQERIGQARAVPALARAVVRENADIAEESVRNDVVKTDQQAQARKEQELEAQRKKEADERAYWRNEQEKRDKQQVAKKQRDEERRLAAEKAAAEKKAATAAKKAKPAAAPVQATSAGKSIMPKPLNIGETWTSPKTGKSYKCDWKPTGELYNNCPVFKKAWIEVKQKSNTIYHDNGHLPAAPYTPPPPLQSYPATPPCQTRRFR